MGTGGISSERTTLEKLPALATLSLSMGVSALLLCLSTPWVIALGGLVVVALHLWARANLFATIRHSWKALPLVLGIAGVNSTSYGWESGTIVFGRLCLLVWATHLLGACLRLGEVIRTFEKIFALLPLRPLGLTARDAALMLGISIRFFFLFGEEIQTLNKAQRARAYSAKRMPFKRRIKHSLDLVGTLFHSTLRKADQVSLAMRARGYRPGPLPNHLARKPSYKIRP